MPVQPRGVSRAHTQGVGEGARGREHAPIRSSAAGKLDLQVRLPPRAMVYEQIGRESETKVRRRRRATGERRRARGGEGSAGTRD